MVYNVLPYYMETCPPCEYAIAEGQCFTNIHSSVYLVCVLSCASAYYGVVLVTEEGDDEVS